jgi:hypothetical protein
MRERKESNDGKTPHAGLRREAPSQGLQGMRHALRRIGLVVSLGLMAIALAVSVLAMTGVVHADWYPQLGTYGVSIGSETHYCYAELVSWHPSIGCERSR